MRTYVVGLMFDDDKNRLVLIHKRHGPPCVIGKWNGVGGKVEEEELSQQTMIREFQEETGVHHEEWQYLCSLAACDHVVYFYFAFNTAAVEAVCTMTDEVVQIHDISYGLPELIMHNLTWMIPFLRDPDVIPFLGQIQVL